MPRRCGSSWGIGPGGGLITFGGANRVRRRPALRGVVLPAGRTGTRPRPDGATEGTAGRRPAPARPGGVAAGRRRPALRPRCDGRLRDGTPLVPAVAVRACPGLSPRSASPCLTARSDVLRPVSGQQRGQLPDLL